jgi:hypothetical protein
VARAEGLPGGARAGRGELERGGAVRANQAERERSAWLEMQRARRGDVGQQVERRPRDGGVSRRCGVQMRIDVSFVRSERLFGM